MGRHKSKRYKRGRSSSSSSAEEHPRSQPATRTEEETNLAHFSFLDHKSELNRVLIGHREPLVEDVRDFWMFVQKYESMLKKSGNCVLSGVKEDLDKLPKGFPTDFDKIHLINIRFGVSVEDMLKKVDLSFTKVKQFLQIVLQYLGFRQKEKFNRLKKLREAQSNLPVAKFRDEIVEAVRKERVVLLAGDTGCGKSTQIPQYLHQAGFTSIGKWNQLIYIAI